LNLINCDDIVIDRHNIVTILKLHALDFLDTMSKKQVKL